MGHRRSLLQADFLSVAYFFKHCPFDSCWAWVQLGKAYPPPGAAAAVIDLDRYDERQLMSQSSGAYPLIVRMETVTEKGLAEGHSLQVASFPELTNCILTLSIWCTGTLSLAAQGRH